MTTTTLDHVDVDACIVGELFGPVARNDFERSAPYARPALVEYALRLGSMSDEEFLEVATLAIYDAASMARFDGFEDMEAKVSMCTAESSRRHQLAGHRIDCTIASLYSRAHEQATIAHGHEPRPTAGTCQCPSATHS